VQKFFLFLLMSVVRCVAKIGASSWYREVQRSSGKSPVAFAIGSIISVVIMLTLAVFALVVRL